MPASPPQPNLRRPPVVPAATPAFPDSPFRTSQSELNSTLLPPRSALVTPPRSLPFRAWRLLTGVLEWLFGLASLIGCLAVLAAIPLVNFLSLGYLLDASGRVA